MLTFGFQLSVLGSVVSFPYPPQRQRQTWCPWGRTWSWLRPWLWRGWPQTCQAPILWCSYPQPHAATAGSCHCQQYITPCVFGCYNQTYSVIKLLETFNNQKAMVYRCKSCDVICTDPDEKYTGTLIQHCVWGPRHGTAI